MLTKLLLIGMLLLQLAACTGDADYWAPSRGACRDRDTIPGQPLGAECWDWLSGSHR